MSERVRQLLCGLGARGVLTLLGVRKTVGSKERMLPSTETLIRGFNQPYTRKSHVQVITKVESEESKSKKRTVCQLSVGARALMKHAHRSSEVLWRCVSSRSSGESQWEQKNREMS